MEKAIDHLGIYDLMAVLFSGVCILVLSLLILYPFNNLFEIIKFEQEESLVFIICFFTISYFIGIIFQEVSSAITKKFYEKGEKILTHSFRPPKNEHGVLTLEESGEIEQIVSKELGLDLSSCSHKETIIYNYCKFHLISTSGMSSSNKDQSIAGLSRSLSLYFFIITVVFFISLLLPNSKKIYCLIMFIISPALSALFFYRYVRFLRYRYTFIFRSFYYQYIQNTKQIPHDFPSIDE